MSQVTMATSWLLMLMAMMYVMILMSVDTGKYFHRQLSDIRVKCSVFTVRCNTERGYATASRPSICLSVRPRRSWYLFHIGWNTSTKIISRPNALRHLLTLTPTWAIWSH